MDAGPTPHETMTAADLAGRRVLLRRLDELIGALLDHDAGAALVLTGPAGIGKTAVLDVVAERLARRGVQPRRIRGDEITATEPFAAFAGLLDGPSPRDDPASRLDATAVVSSLLNAAAPPVRALEAVVDLFDGRDPAALLVDDAQWCDRWSLAALRRLIRLTRHQNLLIVLTWRTGQAPSDEALERLAVETRLDLDPLSPSESEALLARLLGGPPGPALKELAAASGGNPLHLVELVRHAGDRLIDTGAGIDLVDPEPARSLRALIGERLGRLPASALELAGQCAVLGTAFPFDALLAVCSPLSPTDLLGRLHSLVETNVVALDGDTVRFVHPTHREAIEAALPGVVMQELHRRAGDALSEGFPTRALWHCAVGTVEPDETLARRIIEHAEADALAEPDAMSRTLKAAVRHAGTPEDRGRLTSLRAWLLVIAGQPDEALALLGPDPSAYSANDRITAALAHFLRLEHARARELLAAPSDHDDPFAQGSLPHAEGDAGVLPGERQAVTALLALAGAGDEVIPAGRAALAENPPPEIEALARLCVGRGLATMHEYEAALEELRLAVEAADRSPDGRGHLYNPWAMYGATALDLDRHDEVGRAVFRGAAIASRIGSSAGGILYDSLAASLAWRRAQGDRAFAHADAAATASEDTGALIAVAWCLALAALSELDRGADRSAARLLDTADAHLDRGRAILGIDFLVLARARAALEANDLDGARRQLDDAWDLFAALGIGNCHPVLAPLLVRLHLWTGGERGPAICAEMDRIAERSRAPGLGALAQGCRALLDGDGEGLESAARALDAAGRHSDALDARLARTGLSVSVDRADAGRAFARMAEISPDHRGRIRTACRLWGAAWPGTRPDEAVADLARLTPTERAIAELVANGLSNAQIAAERYVSTRTVESHLARIYRKLGISSRSQLVRLWLVG
ncbi:MAG: hypothetical protein D6683_02240 [Actinomyces sp.]|nr:MAG: hypothetical protein D6683_02240 [Actinomyces sp.]